MISLDLMKSSEVRIAGDHDQPNSVKFIVLRNATRFAHSYIRMYLYFAYTKKLLFLYSFRVLPTYLLYFFPNEFPFLCRLNQGVGQ